MGAAEQGFSDRKFVHDTVKLLYKCVCKYVYVYVDIFFGTWYNIIIYISADRNSGS